MREVSKDVVETLLEEELTDHLGFEKYDHKAKTINNFRNVHTPKTIKSKYGTIDLNVPRDRKSEFEPRVVKKRKRDISGLEDKIISMYVKGMTTRDIQGHINSLRNVSWKARKPQVMDYDIISADDLFWRARREIF